MTIRPGGIDGETRSTAGCSSAPATPAAMSLMLDCEFTVTEGPYARRKFWQSFTVSGGKVDENGASIGCEHHQAHVPRHDRQRARPRSRRTRARTAKAKRLLRGFADLDGITFVAKIKVEPSRNPAYPDQNKLDRPCCRTRSEWRKVMNGEDAGGAAARPRADPGAPPPWEAPAPSFADRAPRPPGPAAAVSSPAARWPPGCVGRPRLAEGLRLRARHPEPLEWRAGSGGRQVGCSPRGCTPPGGPGQRPTLPAAALRPLRARGPGLRLRPQAALGPLPALPLLLEALPRCRVGARRQEQRHDRQDRHGEPAIKDAGRTSPRR